MTDPKCTPEYWLLGASENGMYFDRLDATPSIIPQSQLLLARERWWDRQNSNSWKIKDRNPLLSAFTSNNKVTPFVDGDAYVTSLKRDLDKLGTASDFVLMTGWQFTSGFDLNRGVPGQPAAPLTQVIAALASRNVTTRALVFDNLIAAPIANPAFVDAVNDIYGVGQPPRHSAYLEPARGGFAFSHHQKEVFVGSADFAGCFAYVGGIDLAVDRWDTQAHRKTEKDDHFYGWHDIQVKVEGNAVQALWANFAERWDAADQILARAASPPYRLKPCPVPASAESAPGTQHVQVLRTVADAPSSLERQRFMPDGELTVLAGLAKAIRNAECYIYIEEQFLWDCELADLIGKQLKDKPRLHLIVVLAAENEFPGPLKGYSYYLRSQFFMRVMGVKSRADIAFGRSTRVYAYGLYQTLEKSRSVYVHSKLVIIDDRYVAIGSANVAKRSMRIETELTLGIVDGTTVQGVLNGTSAPVCKFAKDLRELLWKEHLNLVGDLEPDPIQALKSFPYGDVTQRGDDWPANQGQAKKKENTRHHIRCYVNIPGNGGVMTLTNRIYDRGERRWRSSRPGA